MDVNDTNERQEDEVTERNNGSSDNPTQAELGNLSAALRPIFAALIERGFYAGYATGYGVADSGEPRDDRPETELGLVTDWILGPVVATDITLSQFPVPGPLENDRWGDQDFDCDGVADHRVMWCGCCENAGTVEELDAVIAYAGRLRAQAVAAAAAQLVADNDGPLN